MHYLIAAVAGLVWGVLAFLIERGVFAFASGLFENHDIGVIVGILAVVFLLGPLFFIGVFIFAFTAALLEPPKRKF